MLLLFLGQVNPPEFQITERIVTAENIQTLVKEKSLN